MYRFLETWVCFLRCYLQRICEVESIAPYRRIGGAVLVFRLGLLTFGHLHASIQTDLHYAATFFFCTVHTLGTSNMKNSSLRVATISAPIDFRTFELNFIPRLHGDAIGATASRRSSARISYKNTAQRTDCRSRETVRVFLRRARYPRVFARRNPANAARSPVENSMTGNTKHGLSTKHF